MSEEVRVRRRVRPKLRKQSTLVNRAYARRVILDMAASIRPAWAPTRVSEDTLDWLEGKLKAAIREGLQHHPSIGKTVCLNK